LVVHGGGGLGEITIAGETAVSEVAGDTVREHRLTAADFGLTAVAELNELEISDAAQSAALIRRILAGEPGAARDIVVANSAAALWPRQSVRNRRSTAAQPKNCSANWSITPIAYEHESNHAWLKALRIEFATPSAA
jgi:anthranilate phosphoribosyltransferase